MSSRKQHVDRQRKTRRMIHGSNQVKIIDISALISLKVSILECTSTGTELLYQLFLYHKSFYISKDSNGHVIHTSMKQYSYSLVGIRYGDRLQIYRGVLLYKLIHRTLTLYNTHCQQFLTLQTFGLIIYELSHILMSDFQCFIFDFLYQSLCYNLSTHHI